MKSNIALKHLCCLLLLFATGVFIHACKKGGEESPVQTGIESISGVPKIIKDWYRQSHQSDTIKIGRFFSAPVLGTVSADSVLYNPQYTILWEQGSSFIKGDSLVIEVPLSSLKKEKFTAKYLDSLQFTNSFVKLLIIQAAGQTKASFMTVIADNGIVIDGNKLADVNYFTKSTSFSGLVIFHTLEGKMINGYRFRNGIQKAALSPIKSSIAKVQSNGNKVSLLNPDDACGGWKPIIHNYYSCIGIVGSEPACGYFYNYTEWIYETPYDCEEEGGGEGGNGGGNGGPGGGGGGGGGGNPNTPPSDPNPPADKNPCAEKAVIIAALNEDNDTNNEIRSNTTTSGHEYGALKKVTAPVNGSSMATTVTTNGAVGTWTNFTFTWNSTQGFTIGNKHGHPGGSAPSPGDIMQALADLKLNSDLKNASIAEQQFYKDSWSVTVLTASSTYVVTIKDWGTLLDIVNLYDNNLTNMLSAYVTIGANNSNSVSYGKRLTKSEQIR